MTLYKIGIKGRELYYFPKGAKIPETITEDGHEYRFYSRSAYEQNMSFPDTRALGVTTTPLWGSAYLAYVWWFGDNYADEVDKLIIEGESITDKLLEDTVVTHYHLTFCNSLDEPNCRRNWHTLVIPTGEYFSTDSDMNWATVRDNDLIKLCPNCNTSMRYPVVRILEAADPPRLPDFR